MDAQSQKLVKKLGVQLKKPALIIIYEEIDLKKLRWRRVPLREFKTFSDCTLVADSLMTHQKKYMGNVRKELVVKMLQIIQLSMKGQSLEEALQNVQNDLDSSLEDLNKVPDNVLQSKKEIMDLEFNKTRVNPGDAEYVYDKRVEFAPPSAASDWDNDEELECETLVDADESFWD